MVQASDAQEPWADDPAFQDAMLDAPVIRADEGFVLRSPDGSFAFDLAVQTLTQAVDILPTDAVRARSNQVPGTILTVFGFAFMAELRERKVAK